MEDPSPSLTLCGIHHPTQTSDGDTARMEVERCGIWAALWEKANTIDGRSVWKRGNTGLKLHISLMDLVLTTDDTTVAHGINVEPAIASLDAKVCPHAWGELCTEADEICGRGAYPNVDTSVVSDLTREVWVKQGGEGLAQGDGERIDRSQTNRRKGNQYNHPSNLQHGKSNSGLEYCTV